MDMVFVSVYRFKPECWVFLDGGIEALFELFQYIGFEPFPSPFGSPHDMVLVLVGGMVEMLNPHETSLPYFVWEVQGFIHPHPPFVLCDGTHSGWGFLVYKNRLFSGFLIQIASILFHYYLSN